jgi:hypothetical protein
MPDGANRITGPTLADLRTLARWVAWRTEPRKPGDKPTKIPKCPHLLRNAASDAPLTWGTRAEAEAADARLPTSPHGPGGIGIMLGDLGNGRALCGIDLDRCREQTTGEIAPWAAEVMQRFPSYGEISPSGNGIKLFFTVDAAWLPELRHVLADGAKERKNGRKWAWIGGDHAPGIEVYLTGRFFTVTDRRLPAAPAEINGVSTESIAWLVRDAAPRFKASDPANRKAAGTMEQAATGNDNDPLMTRFRNAMRANPQLAQRWGGDRTGLKDGTRSALTFSLGGALKRAGFSFAETCDLLRRNPHTGEWVAEKGESDGGRELDRIWQNAGETGNRPPEPQPLFRALPPADAYPVTALGGLLAEAAEAIHMRTLAPRAICAQSVLGVAALCAQPFADLALPTGERKPCSLYLLTIAESGERKTACDTWALRGVREREEQLRERYDTDRPAWQNDHDAWTKTRAEILSKQKGHDAKRRTLDELGPEPAAPLVPMLLMSEPTFEGLVKLYAAGWPSLGLFTGEAGGFLGGHGMTDDAKARTAAGLSDLWDGTPVKRVRGGDGAITLPGRRLSTHLMAQPAIAALLTQDQLIAGAGGQGLVNRFLTAVPDTAAGTRLFREPPPEADAVLQRFSDWVRELLSRRWAGERQVLAPRTLPLSTAARADWISFQHEIERAIGRGGDFEAVRGLGNKLAEHAARLAAVLTLFADPDAAEISGEAIGSGIVLAQHYAAEAVRLADAAQISADALIADKVRLWLMHNWSEPLASLPDIYQHGPNVVREKAKAEKVVRMLEGHGHLHRIAGGATIRGTKRRDVWRIVGKAAA